jgi:hypothetical protein
MSKGSKRNSSKKNNRLFKQMFPDTRQIKIIKVRPPYLDLTDEQIDRLYFTMGKADRTRMKKEARHERERLAVKHQLERERQQADDL